MKLMYSQHGYGKTTACVNVLKADDSAVLLVMNEAERMRIIEQHRLDPRTQGRRIFTFDELLDNKLRGLMPTHVLVDNADLILARLISSRVNTRITKSVLATWSKSES